MTAMTVGGTDVDQGWFVYGVVDAAAAERLPEGIRGVDDAPVELVTHGSTAAIVGALPIADRRGRRDDLLAYARVLDTVAEHAAVVPVRFGSVMADSDQVVAELLAPREGELAATLAELAGRRQYRLRATYVEESVLAEIVAADPRIRELRERTRDLPAEAAYPDRVRLGELVAHAMEYRRERDGADLLDAVQPHVVETVPGAISGRNDVVAASFLVDEDSRQAFEDALEVLAEASHDRIRMRLVGPMAPYDFVGGA